MTKHPPPPTRFGAVAIPAAARPALDHGSIALQPMLALNLAALRPLAEAPTGVSIVSRKATYSAIKAGFGLDVLQQINGIYEASKVTELVNVVIHEVHSRKHIYKLDTEVNASGVFSDFHFIPHSDFGTPGLTVSLQLYIGSKGKAIPGSGFKITKRIFAKLLPSDDTYCSLVKEPWSVRIYHGRQLYQSTPGTGVAIYQGKLKTS